MASETQMQQLLHALLERSTDAITLIAPDGTITYASPGIIHTTGYTPEELVETNSFALIHPEHQEDLRKRLAYLIEHPEETLCLECRIRYKDGSWQWIEGTVINLLDSPQVGAIVCTTRDITKRKQLLADYQDAVAERQRLEQQLSYTEHKFRSLVESNIVGIMVTDQEGRIYEVNDRVMQLLGYSQEELLSGSMRVRNLLTPAYQVARARAWKTLIAHGASLPEEKQYVRKDGSILPALVAAAAVNQERTRALVMLVDISDRKEAEQKAEQRKQDFLSMVSHELRTPLTAIQGFLELALMCVERLSPSPATGTGDFLGKLEDMLQQALRHTEIETRMVAELLDVSRVEAEKFEIFLQPCNLATIVRQVVADQRQVVPTRRIELVLPPQTLVPVMADAGRLEQVLTNYLTNAFKFSPSDQAIQVDLSVKNLMARVSVRDQGPGLTAEQQQQVWERFYQVARYQRSGGGLGLGLYIARTIIAQHQGQVGVESCPGQGATFWFLLPLADESAQIQVNV